MPESKSVLRGELAHAQPLPQMSLVDRADEAHRQSWVRCVRGAVSNGMHKSVRDDLGAPCNCTGVTGRNGNGVGLTYLTETFLIGAPI